MPRAVRVAPPPQANRAERKAAGKGARDVTPLALHADVPAAQLRADPVAILESQCVDRVPELVPIRYGRMLVSPFTFYRGAAALMAADLAALPDSGLYTQLCGDAHLTNFGLFASPERRLVFDLNDFDETLPGPFEWDVKRLAASIEIAGRDNGFTRKQRHAAVIAATRGYRDAMRAFADESNLAVWYTQVEAERKLAEISHLLKPTGVARTAKLLAKAHTRDSIQALAKLTAVVDGDRRIISQPPLIVPVQELLPDRGADVLVGQIRDLLTAYRRTLDSDRRHLFDQYRLVDVARKVVGVGSVGTRAWILLMAGIDNADPLFLQAKQAQTSVLADYVRASVYRHQGQRVVAGQRLMQASSDIFLGWQRLPGADGAPRDFYVRQLRDWKEAVEPQVMVPGGMEVFASVCGQTLARAHARAGDRVAITGYLGARKTFENSVAEFATAYADLNERDYGALQAAAANGRIEVQAGL